MHTQPIYTHSPSCTQSPCPYILCPHTPNIHTMYTHCPCLHIQSLLAQLMFTHIPSTLTLYTQLMLAHKAHVHAWPMHTLTHTHTCTYSMNIQYQESEHYCGQGSVLGTVGMTIMPKWSTRLSKRFKPGAETTSREGQRPK